MEQEILAAEVMVWGAIRSTLYAPDEIGRAYPVAQRSRRARLDRGQGDTASAIIAFAKPVDAAARA